MKIPIIKQLSLYDYRYIIGYTLYVVLLATILLLYITDIPRGLTADEMESAARSATASIGTVLFTDPINAPYILLQKASLHFLGITPLAIKLPSLILAFTTGIVLVLMLRQWFRDNVAVLTSIIIATSGPFMTMGRTGTPLVLYAFWLSIVLFAATRKLYGKEKTFKWKLLFFVAAALSLYTPMMIYPLIAISIAGLLHPHIRYIIRHMALKRVLAVLFAFFILITPLVWSLFENPDHIKTLLGLPETALSLDTIKRNAAIFAMVFFDFGSVRVGNVILPLFNAATMILVALGVLRTLRDRHSARSYMLLIWSGFILIGVLINPAVISVLYIPIILYLAVGIETLIREWYGLFPRNPYARVAALIPLTILLVSISTSNVARYFYGYMYAADSSSFHQELASIHNTLEKPVIKNKPVTLVTTTDKLAFYDLLRREYKNLSVTSDISPSSRSLITENRFASLTTEQKTNLKTPYRLITSGTKNDSLLLRVYVSEN